MNTVLLIEDDEISQAFMAEAIALLPLTCITCNSFSAARQLCQATHFDLIISDINTTDGSLFDHAKHLPESCKKLAVSAEINSNITEHLLQIGMNEVLAKPMSIELLHQAITRLITFDSLPTAFWDSQKALVALGQNEHILATLKAMFKDELPVMTEHIQQAYETQRYSEIHDTLHKLKASCGFLGASRLLQECSRLGNEISEPNIRRFMDVATRTLTLI